MELAQPFEPDKLVNFSTPELVLACYDETLDKREHPHA